ncbi:sugar kinase [Oceaniglobus trochenteri]|uniref:sugar kinase n=1 Tax=Oceaniglobus trochenteri TaxID=2763260 RepID=UPI001CFFBB5C|nr:sugar kinase [Oceaniglobus trochenteri]
MSSTPATPLSVACIGEAMIELSQSDMPDQMVVKFAGDTLNTAIYLRRNLGAGHKVSFVSAVGRDDFSDRMVAFIESEGVDTGHILRHPEKLPGIYAISVDAAGERSFAYWRESAAARTMFDAKGGMAFDSLAGFDVVYLSAITLAILPEAARAGLLDWIADFRERGGRFAFDSNYRPRLWQDRATAQHWVGRAWGICDIALPSVDDEMDLFGDADRTAVIARFAGYGPAVGALKCGGDGPVALSRNDGEPGPFRRAEKVVDSTAAGDSFVGAFLASHLSGASLAQAMQAGHDQAVEVIGHRGAILPRDGG